jgi:hypothetical protein
MKIAQRFIVSGALILGAIGFAHADGQSAAEAESYAYLSSYSGADISWSAYNSYQYADAYPYSYGLSSDTSYGYYDGATYNYSYGYSGAFDSYGGSYDENEEYGATYYSLTNNSTTQGEYAVVYFDDVELSAAQGDWNGYGYAWGETELYNFSTGDDFYSYSLSYSGGDSQSYSTLYSSEYYDGYSWSGSYTGVGPVGSYTEGENYWYGYYETYLAPGQTEYIGNFEETYHEAYSTTPGPAPMVPFLLGLIALRRRSKKA